MLDPSLTYRQMYERDPEWSRRMAAEHHDEVCWALFEIHRLSRRFNSYAPRFVSRAEVLELLAKESPGAVERFLGIVEP